jgi:hypothetical protein
VQICATIRKSAAKLATMNYLRHYVRLMRKAQKRVLPEDIYKEKHHVFPKSIFGENHYLVELTFREHVIAHHLLFIGLVKRYGEKDKRSIKMGYALKAFLMTQKKIDNDYPELIRLIRNLSEKQRFKHSEETKKKLSNRFSGEKNPNFGRTGKLHPNFGKTTPPETRKKMSQSHLGRNCNGEKHHCYGKPAWNRGISPKPESVEKRKQTIKEKGIVCSPPAKKRNFKNLKTGQVELNVTTREMCEKYNLSEGNLNMVIHGKRSHHKGWIALESSETTSKDEVQSDNTRTSAEPRQ